MNLQLEVREIFVAAAGLTCVDEVYTDTPLSPLDEDTKTFFWSEVERKFGVMVSKTHQQGLNTIGQIVSWLSSGLRGCPW
jgi:hypothetical protein